MEGDKLNAQLSIRAAEVPGAVTPQVIDNQIVLYGEAMLEYSVPPNTSLVEVLGPVGTHSAWVGDSACLATLDRRVNMEDGEGYGYDSYATSRSRKVANLTDQTMFLIPLDPAIHHTLWVRAERNTSSCSVSAIRTYPYH